ncbi:hypothetical protein VCUG_00995 [Vavraia culicis subsp. floridensis]|uniref:ABC transporter domain-containing protein n=1 Tax=Vavraia culicis (isolate floridensis) TaxID=948595 RepID=L2GW09_VAVCU|nr:uncharacterized protein VCUG_00995 [Vavraia culicis subsp. floridensis]ELA47463.1 hypothetical protein VCUG_00995 [Vavraia culicis subsp. floridensis]
MDLDWNNIDIEVVNRNKRYKQKRIKLISDACGHAEQGLLAIMGPSGSGKSTLIKALAGRVPRGAASTGVVTLNGVERDIKTWRNLIGYVDQDDAVYETLTARETVKYAAWFKLKDKSIDVDKKVEELFNKLAITHILDCKMVNLSGGERKRVMIAIELVTDPKLIFLDEPTSGLDNASTLKIITLLKELTTEGRTVLFTIHQPDDMVTDEFDRILLLSQGRTVYLGKMAECERHLVSNGFTINEGESFSTFAMRVLDVEPGVYQEMDETNRLTVMANEVKDRFGFSQEEKSVKKSNDNYVNIRPCVQQIKLLLRRRCKLELTAKKNVIMTIILILVLALAAFIARYIANNMWKQKDEMMEVWNLPKTDSRFTDIQNDYVKHRVMLILCIFAGGSAALIPLMAGAAFGFEHTNVKREIAANTYSMTSYYFSVFIFEYVRHLPFFIASMIIMKIIFGKLLNITAILTFLLIYMVSLAAYLFDGSALKDSKRSVVIIITSFTGNVIPYYLALVNGRVMTQYGKWLLTIYLLNLCPNHLVGHCPYVLHLNKFISDYPQLVDSNYESPPTNRENDYRGLLREYRRLLIRYELSMHWSYAFCALLLVLYTILCIVRISFYLRPSCRMRLNK